MGNDQGNQASRPSHEIFFSAFEIDRTEVTNSDYQIYVEEMGSIPLAWKEGLPDLNPNYPVTGILWEEAAAFCEWRGGRLPTEAEWEKSARGTDQRNYSWGDVWDPLLANTIESDIVVCEEAHGRPTTLIQPHFFATHHIVKSRITVSDLSVWLVCMHHNIFMGLCE